MFFAASAFLAVSAASWLAGGFSVHVGGLALRLRDPARPLVIGLTLVCAHVAICREPWTRVTERLAGWGARHAAVLAVLPAVLLTAHALRFGTFTAGGSDEYGYVSQAYHWAQGDLPGAIPLPLRLTGPDSDALQHPLGYRVGLEPQTMVPTYAPGLPLLMAALLPLGACGPYLVVPVCAGLFVWCVFLLGRRAGGPLAGLASAVVASVTPVVLYQSVLAMSDIPAAAAWTAAALLALHGTNRGSVLAGLCAAVGLLVRPNLLPLVAVPLGVLLLCGHPRPGWTRGAIYLVPIIPAALTIAALNNAWYGSPFNSGYGTGAELYALANVGPNLRVYASWMWRAQSFWMLLAVAPLFPPFRRHVDRPVVAVAILLFVATVACYAAYFRFEEWWYLRFLLPGLGGLAVLVGTAVVKTSDMVPRPWGRLASAAMLLALAARSVSFAASEGVFGGLRELESRYVTFGDFAARHLPANAVVFAMQQSGSIRFYSGRHTLRYDEIAGESPAQILEDLARAGFHPYAILEDFERPDAKKRFRLAADAELPWPVVARMRELGGVTIYDLAEGDGASPVAIVPAPHALCLPSREGERPNAARAAPR